MAEMTPADVGAIMGRNNNGWGFGGDGAGMFYLMILFLFGMGAGNWGGYGGGNLSAEMQAGFNNQSIQAALGNLNNVANNGVADLRFAIAQENCQDRQVFNDGFRDLVAASNLNTQRIVDTINGGISMIDNKLCQLELDALKTKNNEQASEIASLKAQIATINNNAYLISQLRPATTTTSAG